MRTGRVLRRFMVGSRFVVGYRFVVGCRFVDKGCRFVVGFRWVVGSGFVVGGGFMVRSGFVVGGWFVIRSRFVVGSGFVIRLRFVIRFWRIAFPTSTFDIVLVVAGSQILIENGAVPAVKCVLLAVLMAEMVDLTVSLRVGIMPSRIGNGSTVEAGVSLGHGDWQGLHRLHLIGSLFQEDRSHGLVVCWLRGAVCGGRGTIGRLRGVVGRLGGVGGFVGCVGFGGVVCGFRSVVGRSGGMVSRFWSVICGFRVIGGFVVGGSGGIRLSN